MAVNDPTTEYSWALPDVGGDTDVWDDDATDGLNTLLNDIDTDTQTVEDDADALTSSVTDIEERIVALESKQFLPVYVVASAATLPSVPAVTATKIPTWSVSVDPQEMFSSGNASRLTIPTDYTGPLSFGGRYTLGGLYNLRARAQLPLYAGGDNGRSWTVEIKKNGTTTVVKKRWPNLNDGNDSNTGSITLEVETMDKAGPGDYYEVFLTTNTAGTPEAVTFDMYRLPSPRFVTSRLIHVGGYDVHGNDSGDFDRYDNVTNEVTWEAANGKFSGGNLQIRFDAIGRSSIRQTVLTMAAAGGLAALYVNPNGSSASNQEVLQILSGSTKQFYLEVDSEGPVQLKDHDDTLLATASTSLTTGYHHIEVQWLLSDAGIGFCKVWVDGTLEINVSSTDLGSGEEWDSWGVRSSSAFNRSHDWDDLAIQDANGTRLGDGHRIWTASPDSDSGTNEWTPTTGTDHYAMVDDTDPDQGTTLLSASGVGQREEFGFTLPTITGDIRGVVLKVLADRDSTDATCGIKLGLRNAGGTEELSDDLPFIGGVGGSGTEYDEYFFDVPGNPDGGEWTVADLEAAVFIMESAKSTAKVTQAWLEVLTTS